MLFLPVQVTWWLFVSVEKLKFHIKYMQSTFSYFCIRGMRVVYFSKHHATTECLSEFNGFIMKVRGGGATLTPPLTPGFDTYVSAAFLELI